MRELFTVILISLVLPLGQLSAQSLHQPFQELLSKHVTRDGVNYATLKTDEEQLNQYLQAMALNVPNSEDRSNEAKAYWINAYNAFTLKMVVEHYPINSVKDLHRGNPWDVEWITLGKELYSLNQIEKETLLKGFGDARIHFAINCAAKSCPPLSTKVMRGNSLDSQLEELTKSFLADGRFNSINAKGSHVSKTFDWYASDFGSVVDFIHKYTGKTVGTLQYLNYDWALNNANQPGS